jgi:acyl-CoA thioesterase-1
MGKLTAVSLLALIALVMMSACSREEEPPVAVTEEIRYEGTIVAMGDSLTAGLGVPEEQAWPYLLERRLHADGHKYRVVNAGISGETSSGALSRVEWTLTLEPDIVILETGANDGLRGIDPGLTRDNIEKIILALKERGVTVVLAGMRMVTNLGEDYTMEFATIYPELAASHDVILIPFFLEGMAADPALNQPDGIHPTGEGYRVVTDHIYPYVLKAIVRRGE